MTGKEKTASKEEMRELVEAIEVFNNFPIIERLAIKYYLKGRLDAERGNIEIPIELIRDKRAAMV